jgi:YVTN family beta-propeller protein
MATYAADAPKYHILRTMALGGDGGWDYVTFDAAGHRLFIARSTRVMVVDLAAGQLSAEVVNTPGVHGIALVPDLGQGYASNGRENTVTVFDLKDLHEIARIKVGEGPDAIVYDPFSKRVFTFNAKSKDTTAIDVAGPDSHGRDAAIIGGSTVGGAILGGILGGGGGAKKGAIVGVLGGTGAVLATRGKDVEIPAGSNWTVRVKDRVAL